MHEQVTEILYNTDRAGYILQLKQELADAREEIKEQDKLIAHLTREIKNLRGT